MILSDKFVCEDRERSTYFKHVAAPIFRKSFTVPEHIKRAEISICGIGFYDLFVNGRKITKGYLAPYINPDHITYYDLYDIKPYLQNGENVIGIMLGDGFETAKHAYGILIRMYLTHRLNWHVLQKLKVLIKQNTMMLQILSVKRSNHI